MREELEPVGIRATGPSSSDRGTLLTEASACTSTDIHSNCIEGTR